MKTSRDGFLSLEFVQSNGDFKGKGKEKQLRRGIR